MGFRFRKRIKILPGVELNLTHKGISSASIGKKGASLNIGKKGIRTNVGIPGTGLSYSKHRPYIKKAGDEKNPAQEQQLSYTSHTEQPKSNVWIWVIFGLFCFIVGAILF
ncbi:MULTISPECIES: DUF4236 domain-containing protein [Acinetobacter]|uniref:DUF4236 domain-containing protein n=1 Tax=Acinetobacter piscicola TaxID=2006115 RepID=A0A7S6VZA6_9GAMM|nr:MULTISPECIES: DUF4236 domain-containing protein [Acinetobacter]QOW47648.1 DUF4236 domain-containing protein [Acinetobacter piscicola]